MPRSPPPAASTSTIVVESHLRVPSDSGESVGTVKAETSIFSIEIFSPIGGLAIRELLQLALQRLHHDTDRVRISLGQSLGHALRLLEANVGRQWRHVRIGYGLVDHGT